MVRAPKDAKSRKETHLISNKKRGLGLSSHQANYRKALKVIRCMCESNKILNSFALSIKH